MFVNKKRWFAGLCAVLVSVAVVGFSVHGAWAAGITQKTYWTLGDIDDSSLHVGGIVAQNGDAKSLLSVHVLRKNAGWLPVWYITLTSDIGLLDESKDELWSETIGPFTLSRDDVYETSISFQPDKRYASMRIRNESTDETLYSAGWTISTAAQAMVAVSDDRLETNQYDWYEPLELTWDVGSYSKTIFHPTSVVEPGTRLGLRLNTQTEGTGHFRAAVEHAQAHVPFTTLEAGKGETIVELPTENMPPGPAKIVLQYVVEDEVQNTWTQRVIFGTLNATIGSTWLDHNNKQLRATLRLDTDSLLYDLNLALTADMELVEGSGAWSASQKVIGVQDERGALNQVAFLQPGTTNVAVGFPIPDTPGIWRARFNLELTPEIHVDWTKDDFMFSTISPDELAETRGNLPMERNESTLRICTYNILGFQGYPEEEAAVALGGPTDQRRIEHFGKVFQQLDCEIVGIQEGGSAEMVERLAEHLGMHAAVYPSVTIYMGGLLSKYPIIESRSFNDPTASGPFSRFAGASLLDIGGEPTWIVNMHAYPHTDEMREQEAQVLAENVDELLQTGEHMVVLGDFNSRLGSVLHNVLTERDFANALEINSKNGVPSIDHIYVSPSLIPRVDIGWIVREPGYALNSREGPGVWVHSDHVPTLLNMNWW